MIKIENVQICGWEPTIRGMRNPLNSWVKSDSGWDEHVPPLTLRDKVNWDEYAKKYEIVEYDDEEEFAVGPNDKDLMERLAKGGPAHAKYRRFITVYLDILAPLYWWKEFETYKVGTDSNSCSTMHKIADKEFDISDFSLEHLETIARFDDNNEPHQPYMVMKSVIDCLNACRKAYLKTKSKTDWWQMIQLLPSSYNQRRTIKLNYETLYRIYHDRKGHKLDEWNEFCSWIESLPLSEVITGPSLKDIPIANEIMEEAMRRILDKFARENLLSEEELKKILGIRSPSGKE